MRLGYNLTFTGYQLVTALSSVLLAPIFALHSRGKRRLKERFGIWGLNPDNYTWFHGSSVGEVNGLLPIIKLYKGRHPEKKILLTASSPTGLDRGAPFVDEVRLVPFDFEPYLKKACSGIEIGIFVFGETELWPALISFAKGKGCQVVMVNATISDFTFPWYKRLKFIVRPTLKFIDRICVSQEHFKDRFIELGADNQKLIVTKNTKYSCTPVFSSSEEIDSFKSQFFKDDTPVAVFGSLRPGEVQQVLDAVLQVRKSHELNVIIAPRHREKFDYFAAILRERDLQFCRRSEKTADNFDTVLLDTYGELASVYSFADIAFIGGSLVEGVGGHNPIEAAVNEVPVIMGPFYNNVTEPVGELLSVAGITIVKDVDELMVVLEAAATGRSELKVQAENASKIVAAYGKVAENVAEIIFGEEK